jgi:hypothetical protein
MNNAQPNELADYLSRNDAPCPNCGYNLRGLATDLCPECRERLALQVAVPDPRLGPLMAAGAGLVTGAGAAAF